MLLKISAHKQRGAAQVTHSREGKQSRLRVHPPQRESERCVPGGGLAGERRPEPRERQAPLRHLLGWRHELLPVSCVSCNSTAQIPSMAPHGPDLRASCLVWHHGASSIRPPPSFPGSSPRHMPCASAKLNYSSLPQHMLHFSHFTGRAAAWWRGLCRQAAGCRSALPSSRGTRASPRLGVLICTIGVAMALGSRRLHGKCAACLARRGETTETWTSVVVGVIHVPRQLVQARCPAWETHSSLCVHKCTRVCTHPHSANLNASCH